MRFAGSDTLGAKEFGGSQTLVTCGLYILACVIRPLRVLVFFAYDSGKYCPVISGRYSQVLLASLFSGPASQPPHDKP